MTPLPPAARAALWWGVPILALALVIGAETDWGRALRRPVAEPAAEPPKPVAPAVLPDYALEGGLDARQETVARTLFNPTRRPAPVLAAETAKPQMKRGQFALAGTIISDGKSYAFLRELPAGKSRRVAQGETINGMLVSEVKPDHVRLAVGDDSEELVLKVVAGPKTTLPPAPAVARPAAAPAAAPPPAPANQPQNAQAARRAARAAEAAAAAAAGQPAVKPQAATPQADGGWSRMYQGRYGVAPPQQ
jgi:hypothetical protein